MKLSQIIRSFMITPNKHCENRSFLYTLEILGKGP
jgi:hypothetical protein